MRRRYRYSVNMDFFLEARTPLATTVCWWHVSREDVFKYICIMYLLLDYSITRCDDEIVLGVTYHTLSAVVGVSCSTPSPPIACLLALAVVGLPHFHLLFFKELCRNYIVAIFLRRVGATKKNCLLVASS
jgi:hypothetical protein